MSHAYESMCERYSDWKTDLRRKQFKQIRVAVVLHAVSPCQLILNDLDLNNSFISH